jgi:hypothetical protein
MPSTPTSNSRARSSADSVISYETTASSVNTFNTQNLAPLQQKGPPDDIDRLSPLLEDDPKSFDLVAPTEIQNSKGYSLEQQSEKLFSKEHLEDIQRHCLLASFYIVSDHGAAQIGASANLLP